MRPLPTAPSADDEISASFMRRLIECIKERTILNAPGYRTKSGPNGTTLEIDIQKKKAPAASLPWTFSCTKDPDTGKRTGGWTNCRLQIGLECDWVSPDLAEDDKDDPDVYHIITGTDVTDDGEHCLVVDITRNKAEIKVRNEETEDDFKDIDPRNNKVMVKLGTVTSETDSDGNVTVKFEGNMHMNPVIYKYL